MARRKSFYAVRQGRNPVTGETIHDRILTSWEETSRLVFGVPGAQYAGFGSEAEARRWLLGEADDSSLSMNTEPPDVLLCYVDGSFNDAIPNYGYGLVCVCQDRIVHASGGAGKNQEAVSMRQIAGELLGAMQALRVALKGGYREVVIHHDYMGVAHHATGAWKRTNPFSTTYYDWMQGFFAANRDLVVSFRKVAAHSGDLYNEMADVLAKRSVGMTPEPKWLEKAQALGIVREPGEKEQPGRHVPGEPAQEGET
jgi:ribonuclease H-related protein